MGNGGGARETYCFKRILAAVAQESQCCSEAQHIQRPLFNRSCRAMALRTSQKLRVTCTRRDACKMTRGAGKMTRDAKGLEASSHPRPTPCTAVCLDPGQWRSESEIRNTSAANAQPLPLPRKAAAAAAAVAATIGALAEHPIPNTIHRRYYCLQQTRITLLRAN